MIRDAATQRQIDAADPNVSTWLLANAGSGKTRVLTDRVARLLLEGVSPQNILCLTYTKAAASEMQNRLFARLGMWAMMPDAALQTDLQRLGIDRQITNSQLKDARTLFARAIETPGGLKIQTIHSFCAGLLRRFPLEANVSPQFKEMEDREAKTLREEVMDGLITGPNRPEVQNMLAYFTGDDLGKLTAEIASKRDAFSGLLDEPALRKLLNLGQDQDRESAIEIAFDGTEAAIADNLEEIFSDQSATYRKFAKTIKTLSFVSPEQRDLDILFDLFLYKGTGASKSTNFPQSNHTKAVEAMASIAPEVHDWMDRVAEARQLLWSLDALERTKAIHSFGVLFVAAYESAKTALAVLDFDDLIRKAKSLLIDPVVAQWVLFRLDGGIDHILVDEAQDTSPTQWSVVKELSQEFAVGQGAQPDIERTIFVVGDKKQSIYSFQGADPAAFDQMKDHFQKTHEEAMKPFEVTSLDHSFRSAQSILSVVDATFDTENLLGSDGQPSHIAFHQKLPGRVDLWPVIEPTKQDHEREWFKPVDAPSATDHNILMAKRIAHQIKYMIKNETLPVQVPGTDAYAKRSITEGDFLILVQRRSDLFAEVIRACKAAGLEVAGADRLRVGAELAVKDINALLSFLALPEDDLSLAAALRSPLFNWTEQELFTLAHHRPKNTYFWSALRGSDHSATLEILNDLRSQAEFLRPYELIERILIRHDGRRKLLARLGPEAEDGIDALLAQALSFEKSNIPSLTSFLSWVQTDDLEVKRQMDNLGDRIRVMTVHGAKGLEAPIVILPDTAKRDVKINDELLGHEGQVVWKTAAKESSDAVIALRNQIIAKQTQERARLLYVAMTRAEKWLIVGAAGDVGNDASSWYKMVSEGMEKRGAYAVEMDDISVKRVADFDWEMLEKQTTVKTQGLTVPPVPLKPIQPVTKQATISPSDLPGPKALPGELNAHQVDDLLEEGTKLHLLLEHLPTVPSSERQKVGEQLVEKKHARFITTAIALIEDPKLEQIWTSNALTEVDVTADIAGLGQVFGAIDRLIVTPDLVQIIDFKSNRSVPSKFSETPLGVVNQISAYYAAVRRIYPDREVKAFILWTQTGNLMEFPQQYIHDALKALTSP